MAALANKLGGLIGALHDEVSGKVAGFKLLFDKVNYRQSAR
jgi:hypothetical protein